MELVDDLAFDVKENGAAICVMVLYGKRAVISTL
jgi:hypothetical protein